MPVGVPNAGTPQASASITARPNPSFADGTSTALAALIQYGTSSGGTPPSVEQLDVARGLDGPVVALQRPRRIVREQQVRAVGVEPEPLTRLAPRDRPEARRVDADGQDRDAPLVARARDVLAELARDGRGQRGERQRRARDHVGAAHEQVVAVQGHHDRAEPGEQRRPRGEPEVRVDDVEALPAVAAAQVDRRAGEVPRPGREREQLDLEVVAAPERLDLVAHERPQPRPLARRVHVRDHQDAHSRASP